MTIAFVVGEQWEQDLQYLAGKSDDVANVDLAIARDFFDIVVHGRNLTSQIDTVSPFFLISKLVEGAVEQLRGKTSKTIVEFEDAPFEFVFELFATQTLVSLFRVDRAEVLVYDVAVDSSTFLRALAESAKSIVEMLGRTFSKHPAVQSLGETLGELVESNRIRPESESIEMTFGTDTSAFSVHCGMQLRRAFLDYDASNPFDLHALMFPCELSVRVGSNQIGFPPYFFFAIDDLLRVAECVVERDSARLPSGFAITTHEGRIELRISEACVDGESFINEVVSTFRKTHEQLTKRQPRTNENLRYVGLVERFEALLGAENRFQLEADIESEGVEEFGLGVQLRQVRALYPRRKWSKSFSEVSEIVATEFGVLALREQTLILLDPATGEPRGTVENVEGVRSTKDVVLTAGPNGLKMTSALDVTTVSLGTRQFFLNARKRENGEFVVACSDRILAVENGALVERYAFGWSAVEAWLSEHHSVAFGRGVAVVEGSNLAWERKFDGTFVRGAVTSRHIHVWSKIGGGFQHISYDSADGTELDRERRGRLLDLHQRGDLLATICEAGDLATVEVWDGRAYSFDVQRLSGSPRIFVDETTVILKWSEGTLVGYALESGAEIWKREESAFESLQNVPMMALSDGVLICGQSAKLIDSQTGTTLFDFDGIVHAPIFCEAIPSQSGRGVWLIFGERDNDATVLSAIALENFLALV